MTRPLFFLLLITLLLSAGCYQEALDAPLEEPVTIKWNRLAEFPAESLRLSFLDVLSDTRCPLDETCAQPGEAVVLVRVLKEGVRLLDAEVTVGPERPRPSFRAGEYEIAILSLTPDAEPRSAGSYEIVVEVQKLP